MKIGIIGLPQTGKKTLFELLTETQVTDRNKPIISSANIKDERFDILNKMYSPKKQVPAKIDLVLLPKIEGSISESSTIESIANVDAICHVVRAFKDDSVYHISGNVDPKRDIETINSELILTDLIWTEKRLERIEKSINKIKDESLSKERELLLKLKGHLEKELPLRILELTDEEKGIIRSYPFLTLKEMILVLNVLEDTVGERELLTSLKESYQPLKMEIMQISARVEAEVASLSSEEEREEFLKELNIEEKALDTLARLCIKALGLISFFTVGQDEVRQWLIKSGISAQEAAGAIHTDLKRGFIRAEVIKYRDLIELKSEEQVKHVGKLQIKGKDYIVEDSDIMSVRFNV